MGGALALALAKSGFEVSQFVTNNPENAKRIAALIEPRPQIFSAEGYEKISADAIFIAVPDQEIRATAEKLAARIENRPYVFHVSGSLSSEVLESLRGIGCPIASLHPLISASEPITGATRFKSAFFCVEGETAARRVAEEIAEKLGGTPFSIPTEFKTLYHASAVMASGHLTALFSVAVETLAVCGLSETDAQKILYPLVKSTVENLATQTPDASLTGTFARADLETMKRHLETLRRNVLPETLEIYRHLGLRSILLAEKQGADAARLEQMKCRLSED